MLRNPMLAQLCLIKKNPYLLVRLYQMNSIASCSRCPARVNIRLPAVLTHSKHH